MRKILYLGLNPPASNQSQHVTHYPVIQTVPRAYDEIAETLHESECFTHLIITSQSTLSYLKAIFRRRSLIVIAIGQTTHKAALACGFRHILTAEKEMAEGIVELMQTLDLKEAYCLYPHASGARAVISDYLTQTAVRFREVILYDTKLAIPENVPDINLYDEIVFTSPSTVKGYVNIFKQLPPAKKVKCIGPITRSYLLSLDK